VEFPGDSLTMANTSVIYARAATITIADFRLDNGQMAFADNTYPAAIELAGGLTLLDGGGYFNTAHSDYPGVFNITADISGVGALNAQMMAIAFADPSTTTSTVEIVLTGNNTYEGGTLAGLRGIVTAAVDGALGTGDVMVSSTGTLHLTGGTTNDYIDDGAMVEVASGGVVNLDFTGTDVIGGLSIAGTEAEGGTWGAVGSGADHESDALTGTGMLQIPGDETIVYQTGYNSGGESWETGADWSNGLPAQAGFHYVNELGRDSGLSRTPEGTSVEFPGESLTLANTSVIYARAATVTIADFRLDNGQMAFADNTYPAAIELAGGLTLLEGGGYFNTAHGDYAGVFNITADVSGTGMLNAQMMPISFADPSTTTSTVEIVLTGDNTYEGGTLAGLRGIVTAAVDGALGTGDVTVSETGTLHLTGGTTHDYIDDSATVNLAPGGVLNLDFTGTDMIGALLMDGTLADAGTWGAVGSGADFESEQIEGEGYLQVPGAGIDHIVNRDKRVFDGEVEGAQPGDRLLLEAGERAAITFRNLHGSEAHPIVIVNDGGRVTFSGTDFAAVAFENCSHVRFTGTGSSDYFYGIEATGSSTMGIAVHEFSTNVEVDHCEVHGVNFAGIMAKTDPKCDLSANRDNFVMYDTVLHHNLVYEVGGEGFYIGFSFYGGYSSTAGCEGTTLYPHVLDGVKIYRNIVHHTGLEGIQVGCATSDCEIYKNHVTFTGLTNQQYQNRGVQLGGGTGGKFYQNYIADVPATGLIVQGYGDNEIYDNVIVRTGGVFLDKGPEPTSNQGFKVFNNTIVDSEIGINLYATDVLQNQIKNNLVVNSSGEDIRRLSSSVPWELEGNLTYDTAAEAGFVDAENDDYSLASGSAALDAGVDLSAQMPAVDYEGKVRESDWDVGAYEGQWLLKDEPTTLRGMTDTGAGMATSTWFGTFSLDDYPWLGHDRLGWLYAYDDEIDSLWLWSPTADSWLWTSRFCFPFAWSDAGTTWLYFYLHEGEAVWAYNYSTSAWEFYAE